VGREVKVHYQGWNKRWDEWLLDRSIRLRPNTQSTMPAPTAQSSQASAPAASTIELPPSVATQPDVALASVVQQARALAEMKAKAAQVAAAEAEAAANAAKVARAVANAAAAKAAAVANGEYDDASDDKNGSGGAGGRSSLPDQPVQVLAAHAARGASISAVRAGSKKSVGKRAQAMQPVVPERQGTGDGELRPERQLTDGARVLAEAEVIKDGDYERCGTLGCILANRHAGLHMFPEPPSKRIRRE